MELEPLKSLPEDSSHGLSSARISLSSAKIEKKINQLSSAKIQKKSAILIDSSRITKNGQLEQHRTFWLKQAQ